MSHRVSTVFPPLLITMGCPVGIGPEIILKLNASGKVFPLDAPPVVIGNRGILERCSRVLEIPAKIVSWFPGDKPAKNVLSVYTPADFPDIDPDSLEWGKPDIHTGKAMACCIESAVELILNGHASGMTTCPITKKALNEAGYNFPGHTEMLAALCDGSQYAMMMAGDKLKVVLVTIHTPLTLVSSLLNAEKIFQLIKLTAFTLQNDFGLLSPRLAVAALNPHAGEDGLFGDEEDLFIRPAIEKAINVGINASGPYSPDTVFCKASAGSFDAVVCMYHDQGLIPFKLLHFADGVNVTCGLPIVRTSVDHGTAYDIAGQGKADPASLQAAVEMAAMIVDNRNRLKHSSESFDKL